ncbi:hypothetical protein Glo7428_1279 [Gloeocapsa sp. PCC 7428]|nr:hypothetical protein Glo7428_1279 [Gloeocapsa sp. PCC 7428]
MKWHLMKYELCSIAYSPFKYFIKISSLFSAFLILFHQIKTTNHFSSAHASCYNGGLGDPRTAQAPEAAYL